MQKPPRGKTSRGGFLCFDFTARLKPCPQPPIGLVRGVRRSPPVAPAMTRSERLWCRQIAGEHRERTNAPSPTGWSMHRDPTGLWRPVGSEIKTAFQRDENRSAWRGLKAARAKAARAFVLQARRAGRLTSSSSPRNPRCPWCPASCPAGTASTRRATCRPRACAAPTRASCAASAAEALRAACPT